MRQVHSNEAAPALDSDKHIQPYCNFDRGDTISISKDVSLELRFTVAWGDSNPGHVIGHWSCSEVGNKVASCPNMKENLSLEHADDLKSGVFRIKPNTFKTTASNWKLSLFLTEKNENLKYDCAIELRVAELNRVNIPLRLHSDVNQIGQINPNEDHSFSCDLDKSIEDKAS